MSRIINRLIPVLAGSEAKGASGNRLPSDLTLLIVAKNGTITSKVGPTLQYSAAAGLVPDGLGGTQDSQIPPVGADGYYAGPAYSNLFTGGPTGAETKTLTVKKYRLQCVGGSVAAGAYGTATPSTPLVFTASAGDQAFTPTDCTAWMLSAIGGYVFPIISPAASVVSTVGTVGGNGLSVPLTGSAAADALKASFIGQGTVGVLVKIGFDATLVEQQKFVAVSADPPVLYKSTVATSLVKAYNLTGVEVAGAFAKGEYHLKLVEYGGGKFRVGNHRVGVDAGIVWSHATLAGAAAFDGSFGPTDFLRFFLNATAPNRLKLAWVSNQSGLGDTEILRRLTYAS